MSIESDADKDLQISDEDADAVVGGKKKKTKNEGRKTPSMIPSSFTASSTGNVVPPDGPDSPGYEGGNG